ncbi:MAG: replicative DNA helicase [Defluviitaleaceae bacterium]|nr:replicative DNA helicase [Defluviitaleaceae bacterium]
MENVNTPRIPPYDAEAEQAVLACMLFEREAVAAAYEILTGDDFYSPANKEIFNVMIGLFSGNSPVDAVTVKDALATRGLLDAVGGMDYLTTLAAGYYTWAHIREYSKIVEEKSMLRKLIKAAGEISAAGFEAAAPVEHILEAAEKSIFDIAQGRNSGEFAHIKHILVDSVNRIEKVYLSQEKITGVSTGFSDFDNKTAGLQPSDLILIAARPSMGKTAFALNIAQHAAVRNKVPTAIFSLEMSKEQLVNRLISAQAPLDAQRLRTGDLHDQDFLKIVEAMEPLSAAELYVDDTPGITAAEVRAKCRRLKLEKGLGLVVIDYLQLMSGGARSESRQQEISEISRSLKSIAREINAPVVALSQLSRACETRADHRPMLSDLRESGAIEQDADVVAFIYRDEYYRPDTEKKNLAEIIIAKQRNGPTGTVELMWLPQYTKFVNMERFS